MTTSRPDDGRVALSGALEGSTLVVCAAGELDLASAPALTEFVELEVGAARPARLVVDLARVDFVDSSGLAALLALRACVPAGALALRRPRPQLRRLLDITGVAAALPVEPDATDGGAGGSDVAGDPA